MQDIEIGISDNICRDSQWQQKRPFQHASTAKIISRDQPCHRRSEDGSDNANAGKQNDCFKKSPWQVGGK